ncbi:hypothetical protein C3747_13g177 [Trypanosoma cruzi]|uniref:UV excision repair protein RAD23 n=2 Tax=Trypanosoma cruzi TaxID=5693 RepID=Q4DP13_TRYCC|nr:hypothetical protein, conserved [Trypanosoma cruzi]EAN94267.1 hypothetical protein, conserved [Trypanosoma cruzi]KAF5225185.1 hypothetical protein ECC02_001730 [Trypanosoma cruzi]KAF8293260.1 putative XPC-binding domain/UBA/TS-N domain containing protein [Trypanosoma cruzi]PWV18554.1 hypothetical protein C3747_13g177 [Trypanosoma cruzi]RNC55589.1 hypothetical protein TcCL_ESM06904 [Trypanosoma cruzi]|eukprot:XP_816118.1 hypothetical protein [Trypanosoma cruzi strain CL Brener]
MKLKVNCSMGGEGKITKELVIHNPAATLSNLRAAIAINFRLPVHGFRMVHDTADFACEKVLLRDSGICDGDLIVVDAKREREEETGGVYKEQKTGTEVGPNQQQRSESKQAVAAPTALVANTVTPASAELTVPERNANAAEEPDGLGDGGTAAGDDDEEEEEEEEDGPAELLSHLLETVPNLVEMRQQFLSNPAEIMQQIQERDPRLLELITSNYQEFLDLVNNEDLVETLQREQEEAHAAIFGEEEELDEEVEEAVSSLLAQFTVRGGLSEEADDESTEAQNYLERPLTEEEEAKVEQLMQLGFTRDQCKVAFFKAKRSLERAANLLFEDPPQL